MTSEYNPITDSILNRVNYGMPSFGHHTNYFLSDSYKDSMNPVDQVLERAIPFKGSDEDFLESMLNDLDGSERKQVIEEMIRERQSIQQKAKVDIESAKDHLRDMKYAGCYSLNPVIPYKDITKLYDQLNQLSREEDTKAWKDISFLRVKLWDEGIAGGDRNENTQV